MEKTQIQNKRAKIRIKINKHEKEKSIFFCKQIKMSRLRITPKMHGALMHSCRHHQRASLSECLRLLSFFSGEFPCRSLFCNVQWVVVPKEQQQQFFNGNYLAVFLISARAFHVNQLCIHIFFAQRILKAKATS